MGDFWQGVMPSGNMAFAAGNKTGTEANPAAFKIMDAKKMAQRGKPVHKAAALKKTRLAHYEKLRDIGQGVKLAGNKTIAANKPGRRQSRALP
jgi:hypothetical protein